MKCQHALVSQYSDSLLVRQPRLLDLPMCGVSPVSVDEANGLLIDWSHYLGPINRPCRQDAYVLEVHQEPVSVAVSASIVSPTVEGYQRPEVVELARLCTRPGESWATRVMLRLWRQLCAPLFCGWEIRAAVAYSQNGRHEGNVYRFDGWQRREGRRGHARYGGTWGRHRADDDPMAGTKTLWVYEYERDTQGVPAP